MTDSSRLPSTVPHPEDKAMPLDLSFKKFENEDIKDDDVIVTLEIPGHRSHVLHEPIVISESDSDSDITVVAVNVTRTKSKNLQKQFDCKKLPFAADSDGEDCIIASYEVPLSRVGTKKFYDDSALQVPGDVVLDGTVVKGKYPFLSDSSSSDDIPNVGLMISSDDSFFGDDKTGGNLDFESRLSPISMHLDLLGTKSILAPTAPVDCVGVDSVDVSSLVVGGAAKSKSKTSVGGQHSANDPTTDNPKSMSDCVTNDGLTFGITQLLSDTTLAKDARSTADANSVFRVSSFDQNFSDKQSNPDSVGKATDDTGTGKLKLSLDALPLANPDLETVKSFHNQLRRMRRRVNALANDPAPGGREAKSPAQLSPSFDSSDDSRSPDISCKTFNEDWKVVSNYKNKVILRRADGKMVSPSTFLRKRDSMAMFRLSQNGARKKSKLALPPQLAPSCGPLTKPCDGGNAVAALAPAVDYNEVASAAVTIDPAENKTSYCYGCKVKVIVGHLSFCMAGHGCCGQCLQSQVKTLLARGKKGTLKCRYVGCNSFYLVSQLRNSLPAMVVEILEEKLDREYCDNAARLMMQDVGKSLLEEETEDRAAKDPKEEHILPPGWEPMSQSEEYRLVDVLRGSDEYNYISGAFHVTMNKPRANIVKLQRVQNTILWEFYMVKKKQMERDNGKTVLEKSLFHGTQRNVVEAICRTNFDWRLCGVHGTMYGQGSYFARDASYSHVYTDQPKGCHAVSIHPSSQMIFNPPPSHHQMTNGPSGAATAQIIIQPFPGSSHSVSIATLQSCRFAHLPVVGNTTHLPHGSSLPPPVGQGSAASNPVSAFTFPYWVGNGGIPGSVGPGKVGRSTNDVNSSLTAMPHIHTMFVARVLVGEYTLGKAGYRKPPPIDPSAPYGRGYDACVNDMTNPTIFVIFNSAQCYPEYIIEYTNRGKDS